MTSLSFDRAATFYDDTRTLSDETSERLTQAILDLAPSQLPILECGVGTGRVALPLIERGARLFGVDLSTEMMQRFHAKRQGTPVAQADMSRLPFPDATFGAALTVHVLHLVGPWRETLREVRRVLTRGGVHICSQVNRPDDSPAARMQHYWHTLVEARGFAWRGPGAQTHAEVRAELRTLGARADEIDVGPTSHTASPSELIDRIARRLSSDTWHVPDDVLADTVAELRQWVWSEFPDPHQPITISRQYLFDVIRY
jgi:ubiquinone/menaquinone biosynthesis C-methylase UbiE